MIEEQNNINQYLQDFKNGKIKMGLDTGLAKLDEAIRYKQGQFCIINGLDNVGKTAFILWYALVLSNKHNIKWCFWSGENKSGQLVKQLIEFQTGRRLEDLKMQDVFKYELMMAQWFTFIDNTKFYKNKDLYKLFKESKCDAAVIDPFTGMDREYTHAANYNFLNETRQFCNETGITVYVNTHPVSEAARRTYSIDHEFNGYPLPPSKVQSEGGQPFASRPDDFLTVHRLVGHPTMKYKTLLFVRKVKDTSTGGGVSAIDSPVAFDYNSGLGFTLDGQNILNGEIKDDLALSKLPSPYKQDNTEAPF
jgi:hypothetical protein